MRHDWAHTVNKNLTWTLIPWASNTWPCFANLNIRACKAVDIIHENIFDGKDKENWISAEITGEIKEFFCQNWDGKSYVSLTFPLLRSESPSSVGLSWKERKWANYGKRGTTKQWTFLKIKRGKSGFWGVSVQLGKWWHDSKCTLAPARGSASHWFAILVAQI